MLFTRVKTSTWVKQLLQCGQAQERQNFSKAQKPWLILNSGLLHVRAQTGSPVPALVLAFKHLAEDATVKRVA